MTAVWWVSHGSNFPCGRRATVLCPVVALQCWVRPLAPLPRHWYVIHIYRLEINNFVGLTPLPHTLTGTLSEISAQYLFSIFKQVLISIDNIIEMIPFSLMSLYIFHQGSLMTYSQVTTLIITGERWNWSLVTPLSCPGASGHTGSLLPVTCHLTPHIVTFTRYILLDYRANKHFLQNFLEKIYFLLKQVLRAA